MQITPTPQTVIQFTIVVSEDEARGILVDATPFQSELRQMLAEHRRIQTNDRRAFHFKGRGKGRGPKGKRAAGTRRASRIASANRSFTKEPCAKCGREIATNKMSYHLSRCQGTASDASSSN